MKMTKIILLCIVLLNVLIACGGSSSDSSESSNGDGDTNNSRSGNATGSITLSGADTNVVGTQLDIGTVGVSEATEFDSSYIVVLNRASLISIRPDNTLFPSFPDLNNAFIMNVFNDVPSPGKTSISMNIIVAGESYGYICVTGALSGPDCGAGSISLDIENRTLSFDNVTVTNADTDSILTLHGSLIWNDDVADIDTGGSTIATELEGTWGSNCQYDELWNIYDTGSTTFTGGTFSSSGIEYSDAACTIVDKSYSSTGTFHIGQSVTTTSGLSAKELDISFLTIDGNDARFNFYDIYKIDDNKLYSGDTGGFDDDEYDATSPDKRPIELDFSSFGLLIEE